MRWRVGGFVIPSLLKVCLCRLSVENVYQPLDYVLKDFAAQPVHLNRQRYPLARTVPGAPFPRCHF